MASCPRGAWWTFAIASWVCFLTGLTYTFGAWSPALKETFRYSQEELGHLALAKDVGNFVVMDAGLITAKFGAHTTAAFGTTLLATSSLYLWHSIKGDGNVPFGVMVFVFWLFGHGLGACDNAAISTSVKNFPNHKGSGVGLMKALEGITGAAMGTIFYTTFGTEQGGSYPLVIAVAAMIVGVLAVPLMKMTNSPVDEPDIIVGMKFRILALGLCCFITFCAFVAYSKAYNPITMAVSIAFLGALFLFVVPVGASHGANDDSSSGRDVEEHGEIDLSSETTSEPASADGLKNQAELPERPNMSVSQMLQTLDFYLLFLLFVSVQGSGIMFANNAAQVVKAVQEQEDADQSICIAIFSVCNSMSRVLFGFGSERVKGTINRPWFLVASAAVITFALALPPLHLGAWTLGLVSGGIGFAIGGTFALQAVVVEEIFGPKDMPLKYSFLYMAATIGSLLISDLLAGRIYDAAAREQGKEVCLGGACFNLSFIIAGVACLLATIGGAVVAIRSRKTYRCLNER
eukprot:TRINITY_DN80002_c0_g1_i1.p1 TRINITY_DN80002_c0_g1~~TRINITY_DN80002_c0_g1_i1.p1  ORF type:complete len:518 (-),score=72.57 TRINITY_DN80002_c0_g1_i1:61-1614(-)